MHLTLACGTSKSSSKSVEYTQDSIMRDATGLVKDMSYKRERGFKIIRDIKIRIKRV